MATYVIGDIQGCYEPLMELVDCIGFDAKVDRLIFCGDLVNRGGRSLDVLRWVYAHQHCCDSVLGNHDLSMLSKFYNKEKSIVNKEFKAIFLSPDSSLLINWLLHRPLYLVVGKYFINHAGLYPQWSIKQFKSLAKKTQQALVNDPALFFQNMYGNKPVRWNQALDIEAQHRFVINASTRMRFVKSDGSLNFSQNRKISQIKNLKPWFEFEAIKHIKKHIIFGHWSALGLYQDSNVTCLDTGKVWGGQLTAMRLEDQKLFSV